jgi:hypothetical protein
MTKIKGKCIFETILHLIKISSAIFQFSNKTE